MVQSACHPVSVLLGVLQAHAECVGCLRGTCDWDTQLGSCTVCVEWCMIVTSLSMGWLLPKLYSWLLGRTMLLTGVKAGQHTTRLLHMLFNHWGLGPWARIPATIRHIKCRACKLKCCANVSLVPGQHKTVCCAVCGRPAGGSKACLLLVLHDSMLC